MENSEIEVIRKAHRVDADLRQLAASLGDESLREGVLAIHSSWCELAYAISAHVCGMSAADAEQPSRRRGRPRKSEHAGTGHGPSETDSGAVTDGGAAATRIQP